MDQRARFHHGSIGNVYRPTTNMTHPKLVTNLANLTHDRHTGPLTVSFALDIVMNIHTRTAHKLIERLRPTL